MNIDFDRIKSAITQTAKKAKKLSENTVETAKLKMKLSEIKSDINSKYTQIGRLVYENDDETDCTEQIEKLCAEISGLKSDMDDINDTLNDLSNTKKCPGCNSDVKKDYEYCPKCGYDFNEN